MKFYVRSALFNNYNYAEDILNAYPNITNYSIEDIEKTYRPCKMLAVELNTAEDFLRFIREVDCSVVIENAQTNGVPCILIYDDCLD